VEAHRLVRELCDMQQELIDKVGVQKMAFAPPPDDGLFDWLKNAYYDRLKSAKQTEGKQARADAVSQLKKEAVAAAIPDPKAEGATTSERFGTVWHDLEQRVVRDLILSGTRSDGRDNKKL